MKKPQKQKQAKQPKASAEPATPQIRPIEGYSFPAGYTDRAKAYQVGRSLCIVDWREELGWSMVLTCPEMPTFAEVETARRDLVDPTIQMALLIPPYTRDPKEWREFVLAAEIQLPKVITLNGGMLGGRRR
jgi:hypothetical protein